MTHPWHDLPNDVDSVADGFCVVIEIPRGSKVKYEVDKPTGMLRVDRVLYSAVHYPANYGFIPRSYCGDGDPLDVLVLGHEPVQPLSLMQVRAIGVMRMEDGGQDDKIIAIHVNDPGFADYTDIDQLPGHVGREIERFFKDYKILEDKSVTVEQMAGRELAEQIVRESLELYRREEHHLRGFS